MPLTPDEALFVQQMKDGYKGSVHQSVVRLADITLREAARADNLALQLINAKLNQSASSTWQNIWDDGHPGQQCSSCGFIARSLGAVREHVCQKANHTAVKR